MIYIPPVRSDEIYHFGVVGMKWGVRRYQNRDGSLTSDGKQRIKKLNKEAFEIGRNATGAARTARYATKRAERTLEKYEKAEAKGSKSVGKNI